MSEQLQVKKTRPIVYKVYNFLCGRCLGKENSINRKDLATIFGVSDATMRDICHEINMRDEFDHFICRMTNGIHIAKNEEEIEAYCRYQRHKGLEMVYEAWQGENKKARNGQCKIPFGEYYKECCKTYEV